MKEPERYVVIWDGTPRTSRYLAPEHFRAVEPEPTPEPHLAPSQVRESSEGKIRPRVPGTPRNYFGKRVEHLAFMERRS